MASEDASVNADVAQLRASNAGGTAALRRYRRPYRRRGRQDRAEPAGPRLHRDRLELRNGSPTVTEFSISNHKIYLSPVMDLFDRQIIAYAIDHSPNLAPDQQLTARRPRHPQPGQAPLVHSDQGFQYQHASCASTASHRRRDPVDVPQEATASTTQSSRTSSDSLNDRTLPPHHLHRHPQTTRHRAPPTSITWYNNHRDLHTHSRACSPVQYRAQALVALKPLNLLLNQSNFRGPVHGSGGLLLWA